MGIEYHEKHDKKIFSKNEKNIEKMLDKVFYICYNERALKDRRKKLKDGLRL